MIKLIRPVPADAPITQLFGENPKIYGKWGYAGHNGIDYAVPTGTPIVAAADGVVAKISYEAGGYGNYIQLNHDGGQTYYAHLQQTAVSIGQQVRAGDVIAYSDNTGFSTGPHLHFALKIPTQVNPGYKYYHDPIPYFVAIGSDEPGPEPTEDKKTVRVKASNGLRVRLAPDMSGQAIGILPYGLEITPQAIGKEWVEIPAYVHKDYVE